MSAKPPGRNQFSETFLEAIISLSCTEMSLTGTVYAQQIHTFRTLITGMSADNSGM